MSLSTPDAQTLLAALHRMGLVDPQESVRLEPLTGGVSSLIVRAETRHGPVCVKTALAQLKVAAQWLAPVERNTAEVAWLRLAGTIVPGQVPTVLGEDRQARAFAMNWLAPDRYPVWKNQLRDGRIDPAFAAAVASLLVAVHRASARRQDLALEFANDANFHALRLDPYLGATARAHPGLAHRLQALIERTASHRIAVVHGDVSPKNILCGAEGPVLIDAECAWFGDPAFDLAFVLNHLLLKCVWKPAHRDDYLASFDRLAARYLAGVDWEPAIALEARAASLLAGLLLARVDGKSPVEYLVDEPTRDRVRAVAIDWLHGSPDTLAALRAEWTRRTASA